MSDQSYRAQRRSHFLSVSLGPVFMALIFLVFHFLRHHHQVIAK